MSIRPFTRVVNARSRSSSRLTTRCRTPLVGRAPGGRPDFARCGACGDPDTFIYEGDVICPTCVGYAPSDPERKGGA